MDAVDEARVAIARAAARLAEHASYPAEAVEVRTRSGAASQELPGVAGPLDDIKKRAEIIKLAGEAVGALDGPQGGSMTYKYIADYHYTTHVGKDDRDRRPGFTPPTRPEERL